MVLHSTPTSLSGTNTFYDEHDHSQLFTLVINTVNLTSKEGGEVSKVCAENICLMNLKGPLDFDPAGGNVLTLFRLLNSGDYSTTPKMKACMSWLLRSGYMS